MGRNLRIAASPDPDPPGRIEVALDAGQITRTFAFESEDIQLLPNGEALLTAAVLPGMNWGRDLVLVGPVSRRFLKNLETVMEIFHSWQPALRKIAVSGPTAVDRESSTTSGVGLWCRATVDDLYSLIKHQHEITHLLFARGPERGGQQVPSADGLDVLVRDIAERLQLRAIEVNTDLRQLLLGEGLNWNQMAAGAFRASVAHLLFPRLRRVYLATTETFAVLEPRSAHPLLEPLWSTEGLEFVSDGGEASHIEKLAFLAEHDWALKFVHCCSQRPTRARNCGQCESCIHTLLAVLAIGAPERGPTFENPLEPRTIATLRLSSRRAFTIAAENLRTLQAGEHPREIVHALEHALHRSRRRVLIRALIRDAWPAGYGMLRQWARRAGARTGGQPRTAPT